MTKTLPTLCGSLAGKAGPLGIAIHDAGYRALGLDFKYVAIETGDLKSVVQSLKTLMFRGFGVSMPFKADVIRLLDDVSKDVRALGACNTVVNSNGRLIGYNTDWQGAVDALKQAGLAQPGTAMIIGSGGVASALAYALKSTGWRVLISARNRTTARQLTDRFKLDKPLPYPPGVNREVDLIVNATPDASHPGGTVHLDNFPTATGLFDVVFSPSRTPLAEAARQRGLKVVPGWQMLLHQAKHQFELYTEKKAPIEAMERAMSALIG